MKYIEADWPAPPQIKAYTTLRSAWNGPSPRHALKELLHFPEEPIWLTQKHTASAIAATPENREKTADASFTQDKDRVCAVLTADCLPILVCNQQGSEVAAIHAGWRGLAAGIIESTLQAMQSPTQDLLVWLGPAIGPQKFEVGKDVFDAFVNRHPQSASAFISYKQDKWLANLYELARIRLKLLGVSKVFGGNYCTYTQEDLFFSYRREQEKTGRMASLIWISNK